MKKMLKEEEVFTPGNGIKGALKEKVGRGAGRPAPERWERPASGLLRREASPRAGCDHPRAGRVRDGAARASIEAKDTDPGYLPGDAGPQRGPGGYAVPGSSVADGPHGPARASSGDAQVAAHARGRGGRRLEGRGDLGYERAQGQLLPPPGDKRAG